MYRSHYSKQVGPSEYEKSITVAGWVQDIRNIGKIAFIIIRDRMGTLQVTAIKSKNPEAFELLVNLSRESVISVKGLCKQNEKVRNSYEILPEEVTVLASAQTPLPLGIVDKVEADFDTRLDNRILDLRKEQVQALFKIRSVAVDAAKEFLTKEEFLEVHTPKIIPSASEGGTDVFKVQYFERDAFLAQSPQLYKQGLMGTGLDRVFEIAWYFRAEQHNTRRHLNESTAVDVEMAFIESEEEIMQVLEGLVHAIWSRVAKCSEELAVLEKTIEVPKIPFPRLSYDECLSLLKEAGSSLEWGADLGTEDERLLGEIMQKKGHDFYFITRYPLESKPFYTMPEGEKYSRGFDLECKGVELSSGSQRIHDVELLKNRMVACGLDPESFGFYLDAFKYGMPPHGGFGFGIERLLMELLDVYNIREVILFPRDRTRLTP